ncbi:MAG: insulinase family protein [Ruminococcaceae bacterium]|nr:insulinase family protein [Oscillospiraceae bacterium]
MKQLIHERLGEVCYEQKLPNGLMLRVIPKPGFARKYAFFATNYGSVHTNFTLNGESFTSPEGVAHYLEHKTFDMADGNAMQIFAQRGASPNAFTSYSMTAYYFDCTEQFEDNLRLLLEFVSIPYYTEESVEKERGIIEQEIRMYEDNAESRVYENLFACLYENHPVRVPIAGTVESIQRITAQTLNDCHRAFYDPSNMMLCVVGDVDPECVLKAAQEILPSQPGCAAEKCYGAPERLTPARKRSELAMEISMPTFAVGFKCAPAAYGIESMRQEFIGDLASEVLMGESSELYQRLYEEGLIDADFSCGYESVPGAAMLTAGGDSRDPEAVCSAILEQAKKLPQEGIDEALFERLKKSSLGRRLRDLDSFESICYRQCAYYFEGCDYFTFPEIYADIRSADVLSFLKETVQEGRMAISLIYPKGGAL